MGTPTLGRIDAEGGCLRLEVDALVQAALRADDTAVQACLSHFTGHSLDEVSSDGNSTPLLAAIRGGDWNIIHEILLRDANPNFPSPSGQTPLRSAILVPLEDEHIKELLDCGANPNGETPFGTPILAAIAQGSTSTLKLLINRGADVNFCGQTGILPLMTAVKGRNLEVVKLLLEAGADPFLESEGVSAAQIAQHTIDTYLEDILRLGAVREEDVTKGQDTLALNEQELQLAFDEKEEEYRSTLSRFQIESARLRARFLPESLSAASP